MFEDSACSTEIREGGLLGSQEKSVGDVTLYWFSKTKVNSGIIYGVPSFPEGSESTNVISRVSEEMRDDSVGHDDGAGGELKFGLKIYLDIPELSYIFPRAVEVAPSEFTNNIVTISFGLLSNQVLIELSQSTRVPAS
jgi:hypothetical protein